MCSRLVMLLELLGSEGRLGSQWTPRVFPQLQVLLAELEAAIPGSPESRIVHICTSWVLVGI